MSQSLIQRLLQREDFPEGKCWQRHQYGARTTVIAKDEDSQNLYLVLDGEVRVSGNVQTLDGREIRPGFTTLGPGEVFGELVLFDQLPRSASVTTVVDSTLAIIDGPCLMDFMQEHKDLGYDILLELTRALVTRLRQTNEQLFAIYAWGLKMHDIDKYL